MGRQQRGKSKPQNSRQRQRSRQRPRQQGLTRPKHQQKCRPRRLRRRRWRVRWHSCVPRLLLQRSARRQPGCKQTRFRMLGPHHRVQQSALQQVYRMDSSQGHQSQCRPRVAVGMTLLESPLQHATPRLLWVPRTGMMADGHPRRRWMGRCWCLVWRRPSLHLKQRQHPLLKFHRKVEKAAGGDTIASVGMAMKRRKSRNATEVIEKVTRSAGSASGVSAAAGMHLARPMPLLLASQPEPTGNKLPVLRWICGTGWRRQGARSVLDLRPRHCNDGIDDEAASAALISGQTTPVVVIRDEWPEVGHLVGPRGRWGAMHAEDQNWVHLALCSIRRGVHQVERS
mmetsp:Transcript_6647/g.19148  ORF Transcript_6647/g.19148 Transcript_6647/m.19148 type:complete len:341 (-) Transcript_6647:191-1213(-)